MFKRILSKFLKKECTNHDTKIEINEDFIIIRTHRNEYVYRIIEWETNIVTAKYLGDNKYMHGNDMTINYDGESLIVKVLPETI